MIRGKRGLDLRRTLQKLYFEMHDLRYRLGKPTIAAMVGPARAAGVTLAVSCDCIVAAEEASLGTPEIVVGVIPAMHFVHLPRRIGRHQAFELLFSGKPESASEACAMGLVNKAVPRAKVMHEAGARLCAEVAVGDGVGARRLHARQRFRVSPHDREQSRWATGGGRICTLIETDDAQEGLAAFNEKRKPNW